MAADLDGRQAQASELIASLVREPWGQISASTYETGRLVALSPWLAGHAQRVRFLIAGQGPDRLWSGPDAYALVPTLSATEALLGDLLSGATAGRPRSTAHNPESVVSVRRGLEALPGLLSQRAPLPDTPAIEIIVPFLVGLINGHLDALARTDLAGLDAFEGSARLSLPPTMDDELLRRVRSLVQSGVAVPAKALHSLEVAGAAAWRARGIQPVEPGTVGASPAATAAWLGNAATAAWLGNAATAAWLGNAPVYHGHSAERYLLAVVDRYGGPVPSVLPVTMFERSWVLTGLRRAGLRPAVPAEIVDSLTLPLGDQGTPGGAGLPPDADTTAVTLLALAQMGIERDMACLRPYQTTTHFCTWMGERTASTTANAHALDLVTHPAALPPSSWQVSVAGTVSQWLVDQQLGDGSWLDKWHASPYYATACCATALSGVGVAGSGAAARAVERAAAWLLETQRADGSWGRWTGTVEETAYGLQALLGTRTSPDPHLDRAVTSGYLFLARSRGRREDPPLWHDKDLYLPKAVVSAAAIGAMALAERTIHTAPGARIPSTRRPFGGDG